MGLAYIKALIADPKVSIPSLSIETTNACNSGCDFCPNSKMLRPAETMEMATFEAVVRQFNEIGGRKLDLTTVIGEPLLDPLILERIRIAKSIPSLSGVGFLTTLQHLDRFDVGALVGSGLEWLTVSTVLWGEKAYSQFFKVALYQRMLKNIEALLLENAKQEYPVKVFFSLKPTGHPTREILAHPDFQKIEALYGPGLKKAAVTLTHRADDWGGHVQLPRHLTRKAKLPRAFVPCHRLSEGLRVYSNGSIGACACRDFEASSELMLGTHKDGLQKLWNGRKLRDIRLRWRTLNRIPSICRDCRDYRT